MKKLLVVAVLLVACGGESTPAQTPSDTSATTSPAPSSAPAPSAAPADSAAAPAK